MTLLSTTLVTYNHISTPSVAPSSSSSSSVPDVEYVLAVEVAPHGINGEFVICTTSVSTSVSTSVQDPTEGGYEPPLSTVVVYYKVRGKRGEKRRIIIAIIVTNNNPNPTIL